MRKNTQQVFDAFLHKREHRKAEAIWTNGDHIWSYATALLLRLPEHGTYALNVTRYSPTTSRHQSGLRTLLRRIGATVVEVDEVPIGYRAFEILRNRAATKLATPV